MKALRARLSALIILVVVVQLLTLGFSVSAVWAYTDMHHSAVPSAECHMAPTATMCPMHHGGADGSSHDSAAGAVQGAPLFRCNCSSTLSIDGLVGVAGVMTSPSRTTVELVPGGLTVLSHSAPLEISLQVSAPPPRS